MAVRFILGRSGTGKTRRCIGEIVAALQQPRDQSLILLVPEQATYQAERAILSHQRIGGYHRLHVLSFDRLSFMLMGKNTARPSVSILARQMIVHRILRDCRRQLRIFGSGADSVGLARRMAETVSELHRYAKSPQDLEELLARLADKSPNSLTALKFADIAVVLKEYLAFAGQAYVDPDIQLNQACQEMPHADFARAARVWVDGFSSFPAGELALLAELLKVAADADIALCLDPNRIDPADPGKSPPDPTDMFYPTVKTYLDLLEMTDKCKLKVDAPLVLTEPHRFASTPALRHIEEHLFTDRPPLDGDSRGIRIIAPANPRAEARFAAREIRDLIDNKAMRYRDIAVIASNLDGYEHYIRACFDDFDVPFFIDRKTPLSRHPAAVLVLSALQAATGGFAHSDIFACLKTDLFGIDRDRVDLLENYCLAYGVTGSDWLDESPWKMADPRDGFDEPAIDSLRQSIAEPLRALRNALHPDRNEPITVEQFTEAVFAFLDTIEFEQTLSRWIESAQQDHDFTTVEQHRQFFDRFVSIFDEMAGVFAGCPLTAADLVAILNTALTQLTLALIPPTQDQVLVGSVERSRHPDLRVVFLLGATQKQFPIPVPGTGLLSDRDRDIAEKADFELAGGASQSLIERRYLAYIAFTRPCERLYVSYPLADEKRTDVVRSQFVDELEALFASLSAETPSAHPSVENVGCESDLAELLCTELGADTLVERTGDEKRLTGLLNDLCSDEQFAELGADVQSAIDYDNSASMDNQTISQLHGDTIRTSVSRLSTFAACPYQYFAQYTLNLKERKEFKLEPLDLGSFYHEVLDALFKGLQGDSLNITTLDRDALLQRLDSTIERTISADAFLSSFIARAGHNAFLIETAGGHLRSCVTDIAEMIRAGRFEPVMTETAFGRGKGATESLGEFRIELSDGRMLHLDGKVDRIDITEVDGRRIALIFDYKRTAKNLRWSEFYHGLDMQLPVYILAAIGADRSQITEVAGAFYLPIEVNTKSGTVPNLMKGAGQSTRKAQGILNGDMANLLDAGASGFSRYYNYFVGKEGEPYGHYGKSGALRPGEFKTLLHHTTCRIREIASSIVSGNIDVRPYRLGRKSPCSWCRFRAACRFDWQVNDYNRLAGVDKAGVIERLGGSNG